MTARLTWPAMTLLAALVMAGCGSSSSSSSSSNQTATPTLSPGGGVYNTVQSVTVSDATPGAVLYCTTDGTTPTASSPTCSQPTKVFQSEFLQAIAVAPNKSASAAVSAGYTIDLSAAPAPTFSPAGGTFTTTQTVTIADSVAGANIYYTLDGTPPSVSSTQYTAPVAVAKTQTLSAIAVVSGYNNSAVASAVYVLTPPVATPTFSVAQGTYTTVQQVGIGDTTPGATIYYTTDGTTPTTASTVYTAPLTVSQAETINAIAVASGYANSAVASASYAVILAQAAPPTFSLSLFSLTISDTSTGATIYYTTDGSKPSTASLVYSGPITVTGGEVVTAIAAGPNFITSQYAPYTVVLGPTPTPVISPAVTTSTTTVTVTISDPGATIYYTTNGTAPTTSSTVYSSATPITIAAGSETIQAIAVYPGLAASAPASATYTIVLGSSSLSGTVLSGTTPVSGAQVRLYAAGQSGYGSAPTQLLGGPVTADLHGAFSFTYNCPASPGDLVYLVATGGDSGSGINTAIGLMTALGPCGNLTTANSNNTGIVINEATTVASAYALSPFMTIAPNVGSSSTNYLGLTHAFATVNNLVNVLSGAVLTITPAYAANPVPYLNSSTVPQARINTLADILNACTATNGAGTACSGLFTNATPPAIGSSSAGAAPTDTLQAILNIAQNPGTNVSTLYGLASTTGPFTPELTGAPGDWTLALTFTGAGLGIAPNTTVTYTLGSTTPTGTVAVINESLAIDSSGNVWVAAYADDDPTSPAAFNGIAEVLAEFNSLGAPVTPATTLSAASPPALTVGGFNPEPGVTGLILNALAIDPTGNVWVGDIPDGNLVEVAAGSPPSLITLTIPNTLPSGVNSMAVDGSGNVWIGSGDLSEYTNAGSPTSISFQNGSSASHPAAYGNLVGLVFDSNNNLWGADFPAPNGGEDLYQISTTDGTISFDAFPSGGGNPANSYLLTLAADGSGNIYGCADASGGLDIFSNGAELPNPVTLGTRGCGNQLVLDGQSHLFAVTDSSNFPTGMTIDEYNTAGVVLSPANGYTGTSATEAPTLNPDPNTFVLGPGITAAIDGSGNLWVINSDTNGAGSPGNVLVEYIGIAAPVVTPTSLALKTFKVGVRP